MHKAVISLLVCGQLVVAFSLGAQTPRPITRQEAVQAALTNGPRLAAARADTAAAQGALLAARTWENPAFSASYSKSTPQYHVGLDLPLVYPWLRRTGIAAAEAARMAAQYRFAFERAAAELDADTIYTRTLATRAHSDISRRNAQDADSLRRIAIARRDAGDASDLDVQLATVSAGQQANEAVADSLAYLSALLDLQVVMGILDAGIAISAADSLSAAASPAAAGGARTSEPLSVAAAAASLRSAELTASLQRRNLFAAPGVSAGFETHDPGGQSGLLPTFGFTLSLPLLNRNRAAVVQANAERARADAALAAARLESGAEVSRTQRELTIALGRVERDRTLITAAQLVASMSLTAYAEGAAALPNVLEAQRSARDVLGQYTEDLASAWIASAKLSALTRTPGDSTP